MKWLLLSSGEPREWQLEWVEGPQSLLRGSAWETQADTQPLLPREVRKLSGEILWEPQTMRMLWGPLLTLRDATECWDWTLGGCQSGPMGPRSPHSYDWLCPAVINCGGTLGLGGMCCRPPFPKPRPACKCGYPAAFLPSQCSVGLWEGTVLPTNGLSKKVQLRRNELNSRFLSHKIGDTLQGFSEGQLK